MKNSNLNNEVLLLKDTYPHIHKHILKSLDKFISSVEGKTVFLSQRDIHRIILDEFYEELYTDFGNDVYGLMYRWLGENYGDKKQQFMLVYPDGEKCRYKRNKLHSWDDLPAVSMDNGFKRWALDGLRMRVKDTNGNKQPVCILSNGQEFFH